MDCHECDGTGRDATTTYGHWKSGDTDPCPDCDGTGKRFDAFAWPGGYPIVYTPQDAGIMLCADCARATYNDPDYDGTPIHANISEERHQNDVCDGCNAVSAYQNWCHFCQDSVDVDEDHPHVCRPLKWLMMTEYHYPDGRTSSPSFNHYATRQQARDMARHYRNRGYTVRVSPIVPPIMPE